MDGDSDNLKHLNLPPAEAGCGVCTWTEYRAVSGPQGQTIVARKASLSSTSPGQAGVRFVQSRDLRHGLFGTRRAVVDLDPRWALPTLLGPTDTNPLDVMACHVGTNYRTKDMVV